MSTDRTLTKPERWILILTALFVTLLGAGGWYFGVLNTEPAITIPPPDATPEPNARDVYVSAYALAVNHLPAAAGKPYYTTDNYLDWIHQGRLTPPPGYASSAGAPKGGGLRKSPSPSTPSPPPPTLAEMRALMAANAPALARARQGFAVEYGDLQPRTSNAYRNYFPLRNLGRLLAADGKVHCFAGEWDAGAESFLDACRIGEDLPHHGAMTSSLVGQSIAEFGYADCWAATTHVSAAEAHQAVARLEAMAATRVPEATVLEAGMWVRLASLLDYMRHNTAWRRELSGSDLPMLLHVYTYPERDLLEGIKREWDVVVTQAKRPYALRTHMTRRPDFLVDKLCWVQSGFGVEYNTNVAELNLLTVAFALRAYYLDHGAYPATLAALAPGYLTRVPGDPFAKSGALVYKPTGSSYLLYSIGPDGVDNGGTACTGGYLDAGSKGDIVAEVGAGKAAGTAKK